jgi:hypothetical protein
MIVGQHWPFVPDIQGIILIDCWDVKNQNIATKYSIHNFYHDLLLNLQRFKITHVINAMTQAHEMQVADEIKNKYWPTCRVETIQEQPEFEEHCVKLLNNGITEWYVAGQSWQMCVHKNSIGLDFLSRFTQKYPVNFYATDKSFLKFNGQTVMHEDFHNDQTHWTFLNWFGYHLIGTNNNDHNN